MMQPQNEKPGKRCMCIVPRSSDMKFHKIWSKGCGDMAWDVQTNGHMDVHTAWRLSAPPKFFGKHKNVLTYDRLNGSIWFANALKPPFKDHGSFGYDNMKQLRTKHLTLSYCTPFITSDVNPISLRKGYHEVFM